MKSPIKILHVINHGVLAGTERHVLQLAQRLDPAQFDTTVAALEDGPLIDSMKQMGIKTVVFARQHRYDLSIAHNFVQYCRQQQFDIIHAHGSQLPGWLGRLAGIPVQVETRHGLRINQQDYTRLSAATRLKQRLKVALSGPLLTVSDNDRRILIEQFGAGEEQVRNIYNGVDVQAIQDLAGQRTALREALGLAPGAFVLGTVARLTPQKGLIHLIEALAILKREGLRPPCIVVGDGPLKERLIQRCQELGLGDQVQFLGYRDNARTYLHAMDCFVLPSVWEGLPYALLEAMAAGRPVIASAIFGMEEILTDGENGLLVTPEDAAALAQGIRTMMDNPLAAGKLGEKGQQLVNERFSLSAMVEEITHFYIEQMAAIS